MRVSKSQKSAKFHTLVWYGLLARLAEFKKEKKMKNFGPYREIGVFHLTPFPCMYLLEIW